MVVEQHCKVPNGKFDWSNVSDLWEEWKKFEFMSMDGLSKRSIMYWARQDAAEKYHEIRNDTIDYYIDQTVADATEFDLATVLYQLFKERFICVSIRKIMFGMNTKITDGLKLILAMHFVCLSHVRCIMSI